MPDLWDSISEEHEVNKKSDEKQTIIKSITHTEKKSKKSKKSNDIKIKTDNFRTGISNIIGSSKRGKPPILKQELLIFLENYDPIKKSNTWYWVKKNGVGLK